MNRATLNGERARCAAQALRAYRIAAGDDDDDAILCDVIADLGHYADLHDIEFLNIVARAVGAWALEQIDPNSTDAVPRVTIRIGQDGEP